MSKACRSVRVRFAPSPTGFLHLGNARTALLNWLFAKAQGGSFLLRLDDTDTKRSEDRFTQALTQDLLWLGLTWDDFVRQSDRRALYEAQIQALKAAGRLYPCYETPEELEVKRKLQLSRGLPPAYDRAGLQLSAADRRDREVAGRKPHWRFLLQEGLIQWDDLIRGPIQYEARVLSDPIVIREDGSIGFLLAGAIDDLDLGMTHVLRGEDHITNTAIQIQIMEGIGGKAETLSFGHFSLITDAEGQGFSKRLGSLSLQDLREQGMLPLAVSSFLMALGTSDGPRLVTHLDELAAHFEIGKLGRATPKLDVRDLWSLHEKFLHHLSYDQVVAVCQERGVLEGMTRGMTPALWDAVRESLKKIEDISVWKEVCWGELPASPDVEGELSFWEAARELLPAEPWSIETWALWTGALKERTGLSGRNLFHPLREKLTGLDSGPEMKKLLPLIGRERVRRRLGQ